MIRLSKWCNEFLLKGMKESDFSMKSRVSVTVFLMFCLLMLQACSSNNGAQKNGIIDAGAETAGEIVAVSEFILGEGDEIEVFVYRHQDLNQKVRISPGGMLFLPLVGEVKAKGMSIRELRDELSRRYAKYIVDPQVGINISQFRAQKIFVLGEVKKPGVYQLDPPVTILEAVSMAGGFTLDGKDESVMLIRGGLENPRLAALDLEKTIEEGDLTQNISLQRGDIIYVPRTLIANVDRFFMHMGNILRPIVTLEQAIVLEPQAEDALKGKDRKKTTIIITP